MARQSVPERLRWAVQTMAVDPADRLLEVGCGHGVAVALVCQRLSDGTITAIDRSAKAIEVAAQRNAEQVSSGRARFRTVALEAAEFLGERFDKVFAVNVNLFWTRTPTAELALIRRLLTPGGALYLLYEPPDATRSAELAGTLASMLADQGYQASTVAGTTSTGAAPPRRHRPTEPWNARSSTRIGQAVCICGCLATTDAHSPPHHACSGYSTFSQLAGLIRLGWTRGGSPGIFG